jgi:hypothetical protein
LIVIFENAMNHFIPRVRLGKVVEEFKTRLAGYLSSWKSNYLSSRGQTRLAMAVLGPIADIPGSHPIDWTRDDPFRHNSQLVKHAEMVNRPGDYDV